MRTTVVPRLIEHARWPSFDRRSVRVEEVELAAVCLPSTPLPRFERCEVLGPKDAL